MDEAYFKKILTTLILVILLVLSFFLIKPILLSIVLGIILAFVFTPIYNFIYRKIKMKNISASIICVILLGVIIVPLWFLIPVLIDQSIKIYLQAQKMDFVNILKNLLPYNFVEQFSEEIGSILHSFVTNTTNSLMNSFSQLILDFPILLLQSTIVFFTLFFVVRDKEQLIAYVKSLLPFSSDVEKKLFKSSRDITSSVLYGQIFVGIIQGLIAGAGFFIFGIPNALLFTLFAILLGIFPIVGTPVVWVPVAIYSIISGNNIAAIGVAIFGILSITIDNFIRPILVSRKTELNSGILLIGMVGGFLMFGVLGFVLGPLILAYLIIVLEIYRGKKIPGVFIQEVNK